MNQANHTFEEPQDYTSREAYITRQLRNEAAATLHNAKVREEIVSAGGPDIGISGANSVTYARVAGEHHAGRIDRNTALEQIGAAFGTERPSVASSGDYRDYCGNYYDTKRVPWLRSTGRLPEALTEQQDPDREHPAAPMFKAIRDQFPNDVSDAHVLDAAAKAHAEGIRPDQAKVLIQEDRAWVASTQVPGFRVHVGLSAAAPALVDSLERSNQLETQQQEQQRHDTLAMGR